MAWYIPTSASTAGTTLTIANSGDGVFVAKGVTLGSTSGYGIYGGFNDYHVIVAGTVASGSEAAIRLGATVLAHSHVVTVEAGGEVRSFEDEGVYISGYSSHVTNAGLIYGRLAGLLLTSGVDTTTSTVVNTGSILSDTTALVIANSETISFRNSGILNAPTAYEDRIGSRDLITNTGQITGNVVLGAKNDSYSGATGRLTGKLFAGDGTDKVVGGVNNDWLEGGSGNDTLAGNGGNDRLLGQVGNDVLSGGIGIDILLGGAGNDFFVFNSPLSSTHKDTIIGFANVVGNNDAIRLENAVMTKLGATGQLNGVFFKAGAAAADANDYVIYNQVTGVLSYDANGNAAGGVTVLASLTNKPPLTAADFFVI